MSAAADPLWPDACAACVRRAWLLATLTGVLERCAGSRSRLLELLALEDEQLLDALAGRRREELRRAYASFAPDPLPPAAGIARICRHDPGYPSALDGAWAPHMLHVAGARERLRALARAPCVAIVGARRPSDYGAETARTLARELTASGVSVVAGLGDGIAAAAHAGALEAGGGAVAVAASGVDVACPARLRGLFEQVRASGCAIAELPPGAAGRRWGQLASTRVLVGLAAVAVVVEARDSAEETFAAHVARSLGRTLAAVPGRITSPLASGPHALLAQGAGLVRGTADVLELACAPTAEGPRPLAARARREPPRAELAATLARVGAGADTPDALLRGCEDPWQLLAQLSELELSGHLARGDGGRYVPREPAGA